MTNVAGNNLRLMKIIPAYYSSFGEGKLSSHIRHIDFKNLEFHPVKSTFLSTLSFEIRSSTGEPVVFSTKNPTLLTMIFTQEPHNK